jgi:hypothetical protein
VTRSAGSGVEQGTQSESSRDSGRTGGNPFGIEYRLTELELRGFGLVQELVGRRIATIDERPAADGRIGALSLETETHEYRYAEPPGLSRDFHRC